MTLSVARGGLLLYILLMEEDEGYNHKEIELKWQKKWQEEKLYETRDEASASTEASASRGNFYTLVEFPYPSGNLHIGHWYAFAVPDIFARMKRMQGFNVMFPIGFDAFGLPAENAAIKNKIDPRKWTYQNIAYMEKQLRSMGNSFDWSRKIITSDPEYYKWTQWLFLKLYEKGLAYKKKAGVNWCPSCNTVLANEQVIGGKCERCNALVTQKDLEQWFFKITDYAERLLSDLKDLNWPESIKEAQRNWIGKSEGTLLKFEIKRNNAPQPPLNLRGGAERSEAGELIIEIFTTRADTLFGVTYLVIAPEHPIISSLESRVMNIDEIKKYIKEVRNKTEIERTSESREKTGVEIKGIKAINPANGESVPIFVADYVLGNYGTGAVMAVPAHDERDFEFATRYKLPIKEVITKQTSMEQNSDKNNEELKIAYVGEGILINSEEFDGMGSQEAREKITEKFGKKEIKYKLRDWLISRQRYWGCPIPMVYDPEGKPYQIPEKHLPWLLPEDVKDFAPKGKPPLAGSLELKARTEKIFGQGWKPECDTMDTFVDSSWYFNRYVDPHNKDNFADKEKMKKWMPVNRYSGGAEHTTMHLLYSRFFHKALFDLKIVNETEPYVKRMNRGLILGPDGYKMSKSRGNVVDPDELVVKVGSDTVKMYLAFIGPYNEAGQYPWDLGGIVGIRRFLERIWKIAQDNLNPQNISGANKNPAFAHLSHKDSDEHDKSMTSEAKLENLLHRTIKKVTEDIENYKFNTAISALMIFLNKLEHTSKMSKGAFDAFLKLLAPFAPHIAEEIWQSVNRRIGQQTSIHLEEWPKYDESKIKEEKIMMVVQINSKIRAQFEVQIGVSEKDAKEKALSLSKTQKWLVGKEIKNVIFVPDKIINFVVV